jgi:uncharacterized protein (DUF1800 family)
MPDARFVRSVFRFVALPAAFCAALSANASPGVPLDFDDARHLLARTGFGPTQAEVQALVGQSRQDAVEALLAGARGEPALAPPAWTATPPAADERPHPGMTADQRKAFQAQLREKLGELRRWWLAEMLDSPSPLTERMTLFWHAHFATGVQKVRDPRLMYAQNALFRREALGNFARLVHGVARDPAMLVWLDGGQNRRGAPNENFGREAMELFTLGEGHYTQADVTEMARACTGFVVDRAGERSVFRPPRHDAGVKSILGARGAFDCDQALDVLLAQPQVSTFIVAKLWREFVSPSPDASEVQRIAAAFRASHYEIEVALRGLLLSDAFWDRANRGALVKSPVELVVGTLRVLDVRPDDLQPLVGACARMGEVLFAPPNVRGWPGGDAWINSASLLARNAFVARATRAVMPSTAGPADAVAGPMHPLSVALPATTWERLLLPLPPVGPAASEARAEREPAAMIRAAMLDPVYQLK